jgi:hypothetical protein
VPADDSKLSRTQRKNQKRAEKKAAASSATAEAPSATASPADSTPTSPQAAAEQQQQQQHEAAAPSAWHAVPTPAASPASSSAATGFGGGYEPAANAGAGAGDSLAAHGYSESFERCMQALVQHKLQLQVDQLQQLGFPAAATLAAVQQHGGNLEAALATLIEQVGDRGGMACMHIYMLR